MNPSKPIDAAQSNDKEYNEALSEVYACYDEMVLPPGSKQKDTKAISARLRKSSAIVRENAANADKHATGSKPGDSTKKTINDLKNDFEAKFGEISARAAYDPGAEAMVDLRHELETAFGVESFNEMLKKFLPLALEDLPRPPK